MKGLMVANIQWPNSVSTFQVVCRLGKMRADGVDPGKVPDLLSAGGSVTIRANLGTPWIRVKETDGRSRLIFMEPMTFKIDESNGELVNADNSVGALLVKSDSPNIDPSGFTYTCLIKPDVGDSLTVVIDGTETADGVVDLAEVVSVIPSSGITSFEKRLRALEAGGIPSPDPSDPEFGEEYFYEDIVSQILGDI